MGRGDIREDPRPLRAPPARRPGDHRALRALRRAGRPGKERPRLAAERDPRGHELFQWSRDAGDRLAFAEVLSSGASFAAPMEETYRLLEADPADTTVVEKYLQEYFTQILQN